MSNWKTSLLELGKHPQQSGRGNCIHVNCAYLCSLQGFQLDDSEELESVKDVEDEIEDQTGKDICDVNDLISSIKKLASQGRINPKNINYYQKMLQNK